MVKQDATIKAVPYQVTRNDGVPGYFSDKRTETRYRLVDTQTGAIINDADGYGFKTAQNAHRANGYHQKKRRNQLTKSEKAAQFLKQHPEIGDQLAQLCFLALHDNEQLGESEFQAFIDQSKMVWPVSAKYLAANYQRLKFWIYVWGISW